MNYVPKCINNAFPLLLALQQDVTLTAALEKLEVYLGAIVAVYARDPKCTICRYKKYLANYNDLVMQLQQTEALNENLLVQFDELFNMPCIVPKINDE